MGQFVIYIYSSWERVSNLVAKQHLLGIIHYGLILPRYFPFSWEHPPQIPPMYCLKPSLPNGETLGVISQNNWAYCLRNIRIYCSLSAWQAEKCLELCLQYVNHQQRNNWVGTTFVTKGFVCYISASLFFKKSKRQLCETRNNTCYFTSKALFVIKKINF